MEGTNPFPAYLWRRDAEGCFHFTAYVYRLCLEYARLWADDRDSMNFTL